MSPSVPKSDKSWKKDKRTKNFWKKPLSQQWDRNKNKKHFKLYTIFNTSLKATISSDP